MGDLTCTPCTPLGVYVVSTPLNKYTSSKNISKTIFNSPNFDGLIWFNALLKMTRKFSCFVSMLTESYSNTILHFSSISKNILVRLINEQNLYRKSLRMKWNEMNNNLVWQVTTIILLSWNAHTYSSDGSQPHKTKMKWIC